MVGILKSGTREIVSFAEILQTRLVGYRMRNLKTTSKFIYGCVLEKLSILGLYFGENLIWLQSVVKHGYKQEIFPILLTECLQYVQDPTAFALVAWKFVTHRRFATK